MKPFLKLFSCLFTLCLIVSTGCDNQAPVASDSPAAKPASKLTEVTAENYDSLVKQSERPVLLDFWAPWCGPCVALTPGLEKIAEKYEGQIDILKVNVDDNPELSDQFEVTAIPRLVYLIDGEVVIEQGSTSLDDIEDDIQQVIANK